MTDEPDLFGWKPPDPPLVRGGEIGAYRHDGPSTMLAGAHAIAPSLESLRGRVLTLLREGGPQTDQELVDAYAEKWGHCIYRSISTRRRELVDKGLAVNTGKTKLNPNTRVSNILWAAT